MVILYNQGSISQGLCHRRPLSLQQVSPLWAASGWASQINAQPPDGVLLDELEEVDGERELPHDPAPHKQKKIHGNLNICTSVGYVIITQWEQGSKRLKSPIFSMKIKVIPAKDHPHLE